MDTQVLNELLLETAQGKFKWVNNYITSTPLKLFNDDAGKIIVECCRVVIKEEQSVCVDNLVQLLKTCVELIDDITSKILLRCLQSLYYIIKFLLKKNKSKIIEMEVVLVPKFMENLNCPEIRKMYNNISNLVYNSIISNLNNIELYTLSLKMRLLYLTDCELLKQACSYFKSSQFINANVDIQYQCYESTLQCILVRTADKMENQTIYEAVIQTVDVIITNLFKLKLLHNSRRYIKITILIISKFYKKGKYLKLLEVLRNCLILLNELKKPTENMDFLTITLRMCYNSLHEFCNFYETDMDLAVTCNLLCSILSGFIEYYQDASKKISEDAQMELYKLLRKIGFITSQVQVACSFCLKCDMKTNATVLIRVAILIENLSVNLDKQKYSLNCSYNSILNYFEHCCKIIIQMRKCNCLGWKSCWKTVGKVLYSISIKLYHLKHDECSNFFCLLMKNMIHLEGTCSSNISKQDIIVASLTCLSEICNNSHQFKKALMYAALLILLRFNFCETAFNQWITVKFSIKQTGSETDLPLLRLTSVCILELYSKEIIEFYPNFNLNNANMTKILSLELSRYKLKWPSKISMACTFKRIYDITDILTTVKILIQTWQNNLGGSIGLHDLFKKICMEFEEYLKCVSLDNETTENHIYLGFLYAIEYYSKTTEIKQEIADNIANTVVTTPQCVIDMDKNDECDITTAYANLSLDEHIRTIHLLHKSISMFNTYLSESLPKYIIEILEELQFLEFIIKIAYEFRLHCNSLQEIQVWLLCLRISRLTNNKLYVIKSISFIIEKSKSTCKKIDDLLISVKPILVELNNSSNTHEVWEILTEYHMNNSKMRLHNGNFQNGFIEYEKARNCFFKIPENDRSQMLEIRLEYLYIQYLYLPCELQIIGHDNYYLSKLFNVLKNIYTFYKTEDASTSTLVTLFEINQFVVNILKWMSLPREVRSYCRDIVVFAQRCVLPLRVVHLLTHLACADLQSNRLDDCKVKLDGISHILSLENSQSNFLKSDIKEKYCYNNVNVSKDIVDLTNDIAEMTIDYHSVNQQILTGSPVLYEKPCMLPVFMMHSIGCGCFYCTCGEYMGLTLEYINLKARLHISLDNPIEAENCFKGALQTYKRILNISDNYKAKDCKLLSYYPYNDLSKILQQTYCIVLYYYANYLMRKNDMSKAQNINAILTNEISAPKYENLFLYNSAFHQKLEITISLCNSNNHTKKLKTHLDMEIKENKNIFKTPESNRIGVVFTPCGGDPTYYSGLKKNINKIKCVFSPTILNNSDSENSEHSSPCIDSKLKKEPTESDNLFQMLPCLTPTTKPVLKTHLPISIKTVNKPKGKAENKENTAEHCLSENETSPCVITQTLHSRTKLLTEKLKSVKKVTHNYNGQDKNCNNNVKTNRNNRKICKNLMNELCLDNKIQNNTDKEKDQTLKSLSDNTIKQNGRLTRSKKAKVPKKK